MKLSLTTRDGAPLETLRFTNEDSASFQWVPDRFILNYTPSSLETLAGQRIVLDLPRGWRALPLRETRWLIFPSGPPRFPVRVQLTEFINQKPRSTETHELPVIFCGKSRFRPEQHRLPWANRLDDFGPVEPTLQHLKETFTVTISPHRFFHQLYRSVVGMRQKPDGGIEGGLCTGLSRAALAQALGWTRPLNEDALRNLVLILHGRQLSDRALLAGLPWFLFPSPRRAYQAFVRDLLRYGWSERCFDLNVPRPWRRDVLQALLGQGHTVVPYAFCQRTAQHAVVWVYDPNHPDQAAQTTVLFDLQHNRYEYDPLTLDGKLTTVVAVSLSAYWKGRTALLASLASPLLQLPPTLVQRVALALLFFASFLLFWGFLRREKHDQA